MKTMDLDTLDQAMAAAVQAAGIDVQKHHLERAVGTSRADAMLALRAGNQTFELRAEIKPRIHDAFIAQFAAQFAPDLRQWILVTQIVTTGMARKMRDLGIQFMDAAGNVFLDLPPVYVYIQGNKLPDHLKPHRAEKRPFGAAGVKTVFSLLCDPFLIQAPIRQIADAANVAIGTVSGIIADLTRQGYLVEGSPSVRRLVRKDHLLHIWADAFGSRLRPKLLLGRFSSRDNALPAQAELAALGGMWGGETAAARLTGYLQPEIATIYARRPLSPMLVALRLSDAPRGKVEIRERFWNFGAVAPSDDIVHPILVYADLLATENARNIETANLIFRDYIEKHLRED